MVQIMASAVNLIKSGYMFPEDIKQHCDRKADLSGLCRLCLINRHPRDMTEILPAVNCDSWKILIAKVTKIEVNFGDGLPGLMCNLCLSNLNTAREFDEKSVAGDTLLRNVLFQSVSGIEAGSALPFVYKQRNGGADLSELCRLCATNVAANGAAPIFRGAETGSLAAEITRVTNVKVAVGDGLPARICDCCVAKLLRASEFIEDSIAKDRYLRTELFQVKVEAGGLDVPCDPLARYRTPEVKLEPADEVINAEAEEPGMPEPSEAGEKNKPTNIREDYSARTTQGNTIPRQAKHINSSCESSEMNDSQTWSCHLCEKSFGRKRAVLCHLETEHPAEWQPVKCGDCRQVFVCQTSLDEHRSAGQPPGPFERDFCEESLRNMYFCVGPSLIAKSYECDHCLKTFRRKVNCARHIATHSLFKTNNIEPIQCELCKKKLRGTLRCRHLSVNSEVKPLKRSICKKGIKGLQSSREYIFHDGSYKCKMCNESFISAVELKSHLVTHYTEEMPFECKVCNRQFLRKKHLAIHQAEHSDTRANPCGRSEKSCERLAESRTVLKVVERLAESRTVLKVVEKTRDRPSKRSALAGTECDTLPASKENFDDHMRRHNSNLPFKCKVCEASFGLERSLTRHMRKHVDFTKQLRCLVCNIRCVDKLSLTKHLETHEKRPESFGKKTAPAKQIRGDRAHSCVDCGETFSYKKHLAAHKSANAADEPFECKLCAKTYRAECKLRKHVRLGHIELIVHGRSHIIGASPFVCFLCGKGFAQNEALGLHLVEHSYQRRHKCNACQKTYYTRQGLISHLRTHIAAK